MLTSTEQALNPMVSLPLVLTMSSPSTSLLRCHVAVIGAGAAGLCASRELRRAGHAITIFERGTAVGGTWIYTPETESDPLGLDPNRSIVQSSLYDSLRTNLPREVMGFLDYPFVSNRDDGDHRRFPGHQEVRRYLDDFAREFGVVDAVRVGTEVVRVEMEMEKEREGSVGKWAVKSRRVELGEVIEEEEVYDGVVVCNGHYTEPRVAMEIPGKNSDFSLMIDWF